MAAELLHEAGISLAPTALATGAQSAQVIAETMGYPVTLKIESPDILHKTEAGGVCLNIADASSVADAATEILKAAKGYFGRRKNVHTVAKNAVEKGMQYAYRDRKNKKRTNKNKQRRDTKEKDNKRMEENTTGLV